MAIRSVFGNRDFREKKTLANRDYYKTLIENKKEATFLCDEEGDLFLLNKKAQLLTGYSDEDIRDFHVRDIFVTTKNVDNQLDSRQFAEFTTRLFLIDSRRYLVPVMFDFREIEGQKFLCTCVEIAGEPVASSPAREPVVSMPQEPSPILQASIKPETQNRWTVEFEHRVRNLLSSILGFSSILSREPAITGDRKLSQNLDSIIRSGNQLKKLFNQSGAETGDLHEVNRASCPLSPIIQKAVILTEPLAHQNNQTVRIGRQAEIRVLTDEVLLLELLKFLIGKAITYTRREDVLVEVSEDKENGKAVIQIDNLGQDIPQGVINFIRREQNQPLYDLANPVIVQHKEISSMLHILNRIDGKIGFSTSPALGEIARVMLPLAAGDENIDDLAALENSISRKSLKVLVIEDEKFSAMILQMFLEKITEVSVAYSGNEALNIIEIFYNKGIIFNAVISDIGLPSPWDGILLKQEIERRWPEYQNVPFLAETAFTTRSYADRILESRFRAQIIKPINRNDVLLFLEKYCR